MLTFYIIMAIILMIVDRIASEIVEIEHRWFASFILAIFWPITYPVMVLSFAVMKARDKKKERENGTGSQTSA